MLHTCTSNAYVHIHIIYIHRTYIDKQRVFLYIYIIIYMYIPRTCIYTSYTYIHCTRILTHYIHAFNIYWSPTSPHSYMHHHLHIHPAYMYIYIIYIHPLYRRTYTLYRYIQHILITNESSCIYASYVYTFHKICAQISHSFIHSTNTFVYIIYIHPTSAQHQHVFMQTYIVYIKIYFPRTCMYKLNKYMHYIYIHPTCINHPRVFL